MGISPGVDRSQRAAARTCPCGGRPHPVVRCRRRQWAGRGDCARSRIRATGAISSATTRESPEDVDIGEQRRLLQDDLTDVLERRRRRDRGRQPLRGQCGRRVRDRLLIRRRRRHQMIDEIILMHLRAAGDDRCRNRNADAAAEIAGDIDERGGLAGLFRRQPGIGRRGDRNEDERQADRLEHPRPGVESEIGLAGERGHVEHRQPDRHHAAGDEIFHRDVGGEDADHRHQQQHRQSPRHQSETGQRRRILIDGLQQLRDELGGAEQDRADGQHHQRGGGEGGVPVKPEVDDRVLARQLPRNEQHERDERYGRRRTR